MNVPFHLRKRARPEPASALLLLSPQAADVLDLCARLGAEPLPRIFDVADGFLLLLDKPLAGAVPRALRLRALCPHLLVPADADLVPALHDDEARALVRERGLVILPGGRVLGFTPDKPVALAALVGAGPVQRTAWEPFPEPRQFAERITSILLDLPAPPPEEIIEAGAGDIGTEDPRPEGSGVLDTIAGKVQAGAGKGLMGLGNLLGMKGLAKLGADMVAGALERVPRLSESVLGKQEAALRELLRLFEKGELDKALRRALPLGGGDGRGGVAAGDARLPLHSLFYSLGNILGGRGGPASIWYGGYDVQRQLAEQYRKAAEDAARRGDYRRAAFIYGKLLRDYRRAADVLFHGGLHGDAALLYLQKLDDRSAAARAFELAGETDRAVQLYRQLGDYASAGDVLRRAGEEAAAFQEYAMAAALLVDKADFLAAADLMKTRALRPDVAQEYLELGWKRRPVGNSIACGFRLAQLHAERRDGRELVKLTAEARSYFDPPGNRAPAREFFNRVAGLADAPGLGDVRDDLRDQALLGLATKTRQEVATADRSGDLVSQLFGASGAFPAALVSDAQFAVNAAVKQPERPRQAPVLTRFSLSAGTVTAACAAPATGEVFVGYENGQVVGFRPTDSTVARLGASEGRVRGLTAAHNGQLVVAHHLEFDDEYDQIKHCGVVCYVPAGGGWERALPEYKDSFAHGMAQGVIKTASGLVYATWDHQSISVGRGSMNHFHTPLPAEFPTTPPSVALLFPFAVNGRVPTIAFFFHKSLWCHVVPDQPNAIPTLTETVLDWEPECLRADTISWSSTVSWLRSDDLELAGLDAHDVLHWTKLRFTNAGMVVSGHRSAATEHGYRAATLIRPGLVAGVRADGIDWLFAGRGLQRTTETPGDLSGAVACFASLPTGELLVVCGTGDLVRVPLPR